MGCCASDRRNDVASFERSEPLLDVDCEVFQHRGMPVALCALQGWRKTMEDVALIQDGVSPKKDTLALGVFDGHSGSEAAQFAREKLLGHIKATEEWRRGDVTGGCTNGFIGADAAMRKSGVKSGTTAVLALVSEDDIVVANCGDSRSVLRVKSQHPDVLTMAPLNLILSEFVAHFLLDAYVRSRSRGGRQLPMSIDHKPGRKNERRRILRCGGYLDESEPGHPRVVCDSLNMSIATSRALGDFDFKNNSSRPPQEQMISPIPDFYTRQRAPEDEFLVLASDGVWDVIDNPGIVSFLAQEVETLAQDKDNGGAESREDVAEVELLARAVLRRCLDLGSRDNMTIVIADLRRPEQKSSEARIEGQQGTDDVLAAGAAVHPQPPLTTEVSPTEGAQQDRTERAEGSEDVAAGEDRQARNGGLNAEGAGALAREESGETRCTVREVTSGAVSERADGGGAVEERPDVGPPAQEADPGASAGKRVSTAYGEESEGMSAKGELEADGVSNPDGRSSDANASGIVAKIRSAVEGVLRPPESTDGQEGAEQAGFR